MPLLFLLFCDGSTLDTHPVEGQLGPYPYVVSAESGRAYFKMMPGPASDPSRGHGHAFRILGNGADSLLWSVSGWYAYPEELRLTGSGEHLAYVPIWLHGSVPRHDQTGLAFFHNGVLVRCYSSLDLLGEQHAVNLAAQKDTATMFVSPFWLNSYRVRKSNQYSAEFTLPGRVLQETLVFQLEAENGEWLHFDPTSGEQILDW